MILFYRRSNADCVAGGSGDAVFFLIERRADEVLEVRLSGNIVFLKIRREVGAAF